MQKYILDYLVSLLRLDVNNPLILMELTSIKDKEEFRLFCKNNIRRIELTYKNPLEKLLILKNLFEEDINKKRLTKVENKITELENKFIYIRAGLINNNYIPLKDIFIKANQKRYFSDFELKLLSTIGNSRQLVNLSYQHELGNEIQKAFEKLILKSTETTQIALETIKKLEIKK